MKHLFVLFALLLALASLGVYWSAPDMQSDVPVIYWVSDNNPAREAQIALFEKWMIDNGYPPVDMRLDASNNDISKKVIQGVSGVGGDNMDLGAGRDVRYLQAVGLLKDVTEDGLASGFSPDRTWRAVAPELTVPDRETGELRQFAFPCNVSVGMFWANVATFEQYGLSAPPRRWTFEQFEEIGKAFVTAANPEGIRARVFFANSVSPGIMRMSLGLSEFNETLTASTLDDPRQVEVLERLYKWMYVDRLLPTAADSASFATEAGYGGSSLQLFNSGRFAMVNIGRYALIQFREFNHQRRAAGEPLLKLSVSEPPHGIMPVTNALTRCNAVYIGSNHPELATRFLEFLGSEEYNMHIVRDADALPPSPQYTQTRAYTHPPDYPEEWGVHEPFAEAMRDIAVGGAYSPFVLPSTAQRLEREAQEAFVAGQVSASGAARLAAASINNEIQRTLRENPDMKPRYEMLVARQKEIDRLRAAGEPVPLEWIDNPLHQRYYQEKGWAR